MNWLVTIAVLLIVLWILAEVIGWALGALIHLLWIGGLILLVMWAFQKMRARA